MFSPPDLKEFGRHLVGANSFSANILYWLDSGYFATKAEYLPLIHTWSLAVEAQFYLVFPVAVLFAMRFGTNFTYYALLGAAVLSLVVAHQWSSSSITRDAAFYLLITRAWELIAGSLMAFGDTDKDDEDLLRRRRSILLSIFGIVGIIWSAVYFNSTTQHPSALTLIPVIATCLILRYANRRSPVASILSFYPLWWVGQISYSFYLAHQPALAFARVALARQLSSVEAAGLLIFALAAGAMTYHFIERPFRQRTRFSTSSIAQSSILATTFLILTGAAFSYFDGVPKRMDATVTATLDVLQKGSLGRAEGIRLGRCHWNPTVEPEVKIFLDEWDCVPNELVHPRILVVGDSISADKAWMLRQAGISVGNLGGAGCPILLPKSADEPCWKILTKARELVRSGGIDGIVLSQNWYDPVSTIDINAIIDFWSQPNVGLLIFSGMPVFSDFKDQVVKLSRQGVSLERITFDANRYDAHLASLTAFQLRGVAVIDSRALLCAAQRQCSAYANGIPLVGDPTHLQPAGARLMAAHLREDRTWNKWYRSLARHRSP